MEVVPVHDGTIRLEEPATQPPPTLRLLVHKEIFVLAARNIFALGVHDAGRPPKSHNHDLRLLPGLAPLVDYTSIAPHARAQAVGVVSERENAKVVAIVKDLFGRRDNITPGAAPLEDLFDQDAPSDAERVLVAALVGNVKSPPTFARDRKI